jgi:hypothetical protein
VVADQPSAGTLRAQHEPCDFVDASGGALAALVAGVARRRGVVGASAATTSAALAVPDEIAVVLAEIGATLPPVASIGSVEASTRTNVADWGLALFAGEGQLERLALARIARDVALRRLPRGTGTDGDGEAGRPS